MDIQSEGRPKGSFPWLAVGGLVAVVGVSCVIGFALARDRSSVVREAPVVTVAPEPQRVYVDARSLAAAEFKRMEGNTPAGAPATQPADMPPTAVPGDVARGTGLIAVKKGGKAKVATVAKVADKPRDPDYAAGTGRPPYGSNPGGVSHAPSPPQSSGPRVYGEETAQERYWRLQREAAARNRTEPGPTIRETREGSRIPVGGIR
jgi:hypothetical protein